jgi:hypothetical protein
MDKKLYKGKKKRKRVKNYYYDIISINSFMEVEELMEILPVEQLKNHCKSNNNGKIIFPASGTGFAYGYRSKLEVSTATDEFLEIIKKYDFGRLTKLEITREIIFGSKKRALKFQYWWDDNVFKNWSRGKGFVFKKDSHTKYIGKHKGKKSVNYLKGYVGNSKIPLKGKSNDYCFRTEFTLSGYRDIQRILKIDNYHDLLPAKKMYKILSKRYIRIPTVNQDRIKKIAIKFYKDRKYGIFIGDKINNYSLLEKWIKNIKDYIKIKGRLMLWENNIGLKRRRLRSIDKEISNKPIRWFLK